MLIIVAFGPSHPRWTKRDVSLNAQPWAQVQVSNMLNVRVNCYPGNGGWWRPLWGWQLGWLTNMVPFCRTQMGHNRSRWICWMHFGVMKSNALVAAVVMVGWTINLRNCFYLWLHAFLLTMLSMPSLAFCCRAMDVGNAYQHTVLMSDQSDFAGGILRVPGCESEYILVSSNPICIYIYIYIYMYIYIYT